MEPERDKDVPNKHNPHALSRSTALRHRTCMCVFARAFEKGGRVMRGETKRALVFWVCLASALSQRLWFQSVTVSRDCGSVSAAPLLSLLPLLGSAQHLLLAVGTGQGRGSLATEGYASTSFSLCFSPSLPLLSPRLAHSIPDESRGRRNELYPNFLWCLNGIGLFSC